MDGGAWWATVHGVVMSWTRLSDFTFTFIKMKIRQPHSANYTVIVQALYYLFSSFEIRVKNDIKKSSLVHLFLPSSFSSRHTIFLVLCTCCEPLDIGRLCTGCSHFPSKNLSSQYSHGPNPYPLSSHYSGITFSMRSILTIKFTVPSLKHAFQNHSACPGFSFSVTFITF